MLWGNQENINKPEVADSEDSGLIPAAITDTGCERDLNEDRYAVIEGPAGLAWLVCDGMGGVTGGELAAQLAIDGMRRDLEGLPARTPEVALRSAILEANRIIVLRRQNQAFAQMGTTVVAALFSGAELALGNVGDSRAYVISKSKIRQLTVDHTYVQELVERGQIQPEEALLHPQAHILTRAIGSEPGLKADVDRYWIWHSENTEEQECLLLCTDGLYSHVSDEEIANIVSINSPQTACVELVELAKQRGGYDNITISIIPLGGQLKTEPPLGVSDKVQKELQAIKSKAKSANHRAVIKTIITILILSALFSLLVVLLMAYTLSKGNI